jgi:hypothetical protein
MVSRKSGDVPILSDGKAIEQRRVLWRTIDKAGVELVGGNVAMLLHRDILPRLHPNIGVG